VVLSKHLNFKRVVVVFKSFLNWKHVLLDWLYADTGILWLLTCDKTIELGYEIYYLHVALDSTGGIHEED
jgi:hypothetical protein